MPGPLLPFAYDGKVGEEKLGELLALGAEKPYLDFKKELDLADPKKKLDFIKDCAAMMNLPRGGYLVIGANDDGTPAQGAMVPTKEMFDSAALTQIVGGYVDAPVDIRSQVHTLKVQGSQVCMAVIYIAPPADGIPAVMSRAGFLPSPSGGAKIYRFHEGSVFTRMGTTNALVTHQTWRQVLSNFRDYERADARHDSDELLRRVVQGFGTTATPSPVIPDLGMDATTFTESVRAALVQNNERIVRRFLVTAKAAYLSAVGDEERATTLNRIAAVAVEAIALGDLVVVKHSMDALFELYQTQLADLTRTQGKPGAPVRWLEIILRTMAVGAAAVRSGMYDVIPDIVLRRIGDDTYSYRSWIRHGLTEASRANLLVRSDGSGKGGNLIAFSADLLLENSELRPDIQLGVTSDSEAFIDSLCQFDFLWCCLSLASVGEGSTSAAFYPSCSAYHQHRVMPAIHRLEEPEKRAAVFGNIPDDQIADAILGVIKLAHSQSWNYGGWWSGVDDLASAGWIRKNASEADPMSR